MSTQSSDLYRCLQEANEIRHLRQYPPRSNNGKQIRSFTDTTSLNLQYSTPLNDISTQFNNIYRNLQEADEIRLLRLHPRSNNGDVVCTIVHARLSDEPEYEALSYEWGPEKPKLLEINQRPFTTRENLWYALCHLVPDEGTRVLWVDAICINQSDDIERGHQVRQMGKIYSRATTVVVWLGSSDGATKVAFELLSSPELWAGLNGPTGNLHEYLWAFTSLFRRTYWTRLWIIQEIILARKIVIRCGEDSCSWLNLSSFCRILEDPPEDKLNVDVIESNHSQRMAIIFGAIHKSAAWQYFRAHSNILRTGNYGTADVLPLLNLLEKFSGAKCYDERDKLFGLTSLTMPCCRDAIPIDYSLPWRDIYDIALQHHILQHNITGPCTDRYSMVSIAQTAQKTLGLTSEHCKFTNLSLYQIKLVTIGKPKYDHELLRLSGYPRGRLLYTGVSMVANALDGESLDGMPLPYLNTMIELEIEYIAKLFMDSSRLNISPITAEFENVQSFTGTRSSCSGLGGNGTSPQDYRFRLNKQRTNLPTEIELSNFNKIKKVAEASVPKKFRNNCQFAVEENGLFCFVPSQARVGDIICHFESSDIICILREDPKERQIGQDYQLIGRATSYLPMGTSRAFKIHAYEQTQFTHHSYEYHACPSQPSVDLYLDLTAFYMLTSASAPLDSDERMRQNAAFMDIVAVPEEPPNQARTFWHRLAGLVRPQPPINDVLSALRS